jgi:hypothetical protein
VDKIINKEEIDFIIFKAPFFVSHSKDILYKLNINDIMEYRKKLLDIKC